MKWIGLTGGIATGKTQVAQILRDLDVAVLDADEMARKVVAKGTPGLDKVITAFGPEWLDQSGELKRRELGRHVFSDRALLEKLEGIIHPLVQDAVKKERRKLEDEECPVAFYDVPLIYEKDLADNFDAVVVVAADLEIQKARMKVRGEGLSESEIEQRLSAQLPLEEKIEQADYVVWNNGSLEDLKEEVELLLEEIDG